MEGGSTEDYDMTEVSKITCDQCDNDLTYTENCEDYYVVLGNGSKSPWYLRDGRRGGAVTAMAIAPPIKGGTKHFCGVGCLAAWLAEKYPRAAEDYDRLQKRREWLIKQKAANSTSPPIP
jgi:hypothetical protein